MRQNTPILALFAFTTLAASAWAGDLTIGKPTVKGDDVSFPIILQGDVGKGVSQANFRLEYDPNVLEPVSVETGGAAASANKDVSSHLTEDGRYNVIMFGLNRDSVVSGEVAQVIMRRKPGAPEETSVGVVDVALSDADAGAIPSRGSSETLRLAATTEEPQNEDPDNSDDGTGTETPDQEQPGTGNTDTEGPEPAPAGTTPDTGAPIAPAPGQGTAAVPGPASPEAVSGIAMQPTPGTPAAAAAAAGANTASAPETPSATTQDPFRNPNVATGNTGNTSETPEETPGTPSAQPEPTAVAALTPGGEAASAAAGEALEGAAATPGGTAALPTASDEPSKAKAMWFIVAGVIGVVLVAILLLRRRIFS